MRPVWKGSVTFGLVTIPVSALPARTERDITFTYLHAPCGTRLQMRRYCPVCQRLVETKEQTRVYEVARNRYVPISKEETDAVRPPSSHALRILDFIDAGEVDPIYYEKPYYLSPLAGGERTYALLRRAMETTRRAGIGKVSLREGKEHLAVVRVMDRSLLMETVAFPDEVRTVDQVEGLPGEVEFDPRELKLAVDLVKALEAPFDPGRYTDEYRRSLEELIEAKQRGETLEVVPQAPSAELGDLMDTLRQSIERMREARAEPEEPAAEEKAHARRKR